MMTHGPVVLDASPGDDLVARIKRALLAAPGHAVVIDLRHTAALDPSALHALGVVADAAHALSGEVFLTGATPEVYKALHVAGIAARFQRLSAAPSTTTHIPPVERTP